MINILGGAGFIGSRICQHLDSLCEEYVVFDKKLSGTSFVDVTDASSLARLPTAEILVNLAAEHKDNVIPVSRYYDVNVTGAANVCRYCRDRGINKVIFTSSVAVYGNTTSITEEPALNDYGKSKLAAERVYQDWHNEDPSNRTLVIIRPVVVFGEENRGNVYNLLSQIASRRFIMIGRGRNYKSMAYVGNVADFIIHCFKLNSGAYTFNYADGPDLDMNTLVEMSQTAMFGKASNNLRIPASMALLAAQIIDIAGRITNSEFNVSKVRVNKFLSSSQFHSSHEKIGFIPKFTTVQGLQRMIKYEFPKDNRA